MTFSQSVLTMFFCMVIVFMVLIALWGAIKMFSSLIQILEKKTNNTDNANIELGER